jgi:hypothetical protein
MTKAHVGQVIALTCLAGGFITLVHSAAINIEIIKEVNKALPAEMQFNYLGWGPLTRSDLRKKYREFYPRGVLLRSLNRHYIALGALMFVSMVALWLLK